MLEWGLHIYIGSSSSSNRGRYVVLPCFYSSPEQTIQTVALEVIFHTFTLKQQLEFGGAVAPAGRHRKKKNQWSLSMLTHQFDVQEVWEPHILTNWGSDLFSTRTCEGGWILIVKQAKTWRSRANSVQENLMATVGSTTCLERQEWGREFSCLQSATSPPNATKSYTLLL